MKRKITILAAAFALLAFLTLPVGMRGQSDYSNTETSNVTLTTIGGTNTYTCQVNNNDGIKVGTSSAGGSWCVTVPAGTTYLHLHAAAWKGVNGLSLNITGATASPNSIALTANTGATGNSPFTISNVTDHYFVITLSNIVSETTLTFATSTAKRFIVWGVNSEEGGSSNNPSFTASDVNLAYSATGGQISYTLDDQGTSGTVTAAVTAGGNWLTLGQGITSPISFTCSANDFAFARTATVRLTYTYGTNNQSVTFDVHVTQALKSDGFGSENNPLSVAQALTAIDNYGDITGVYATGIVSEISYAYTQNNGITFNMVDNSGDTDFLQAYKCQGVEAPNVRVGDVAVVSGNLTKYNTTYEFGQGCQLVSLTHSGTFVETPTFSPAAGTYTEPQTVTISCATPNVDIFYTMDGTEPTDESTPYSGAITVSETTTIKAIAYDGDTPSLVASATYTINLPYSGPAYARVDNVSYLTDGVKVIFAARYDNDATHYYAMSNTASGKPTGVQFASTTSGNFEVLPANILNSESSYCWTVGVTSNGYTFTNATGQTIGYTSGTNFAIGGDNTEWTVENGTSGENAMVSSYTAFNIINSGVNARAFALNNSHNFGPYAISNNNNADYNFSIDIFVQGAEPVVTPSIVANDVEIAYDVTSGAIEYTINNPAGGVLTAATSAEWLTLGTVGETVPFTCNANSGASRTATVTLTYTYNRETVTKEVTVTQAAAPAIASLPFAFDGGRADIETTDGLTQDGLDSDYDSSPKLKFKTTGTWVILHFNERPGILTFDIKGNGFSEGTFTVQTSEDGVTYTDLENYTDANFGNTLHSEEFDNLGENVRYIKWIYTEKINGNIALGNISLTAYTVPGPSIVAENVSIAYDDEEGSIVYSINNGVEGGVVTAATQSDWLTLPNSFASPIVFSCSANTGAERSAVVTLTYTYNRETVTKNVTVTQAGDPNAINNISDITGAGTYTVQGTIVAKSTRGFVLGDGTGYVYYYKGNDFVANDYAIGDIKKLSGTVSAPSNYKVYQFGSDTQITDATTSNYVAENPTAISGSDMDARVGASTCTLSDYVQYEGKLSISNGHYNITNIDGATTAIGSISYPLNTEEITALSGKQVKVTGYYVGISSSTYYNTMLSSIEEVEVQHEQYTLTVSNLVDVNTYVFDAANQNDMLLEGEGSVQIYDGTQVLISVDVEDGYILESLMVDGVDVTSQIDGTTGLYTFTMPTHNVTVTATAIEYVVGNYVRISDLSQLTDGCKVIIAARYDEEHTNGYYAMPGVTSGKPDGVAFTSLISGNDEILPATITSSENTYYWTVNVTENGYTFTNADGQMIGYSSGTNFATNNNTEWTIALETAGNSAMVAEYTGFVIRNGNTDTRAFAFNGTAFGAYSTTNINAPGYNFYLDFFVQTEASETLTQTIALASGDNWVSFYVETNMDDLKAALVEALGNSRIVISSLNSGQATWNGRLWVGQLRALDLSQMYKINVASSCEITLEAMPIDPATLTINIVNGINWIGFPFSESMTVANAFSGFAYRNDVVKSQSNGQATWNSRIWTGQLKNLEPGKGYIYISADPTTPKTFTYPTSSKAMQKGK